MSQDFVHYHAKDFTGVVRVALPAAQPFAAQVREAPGWRTIGNAATRAVAESIARGYRTDKRREGTNAQTRITERRRSGGYAYIAV